MRVQTVNNNLKVEDLNKDLLKTLNRYEVNPKDFIRLKKQFATETKDNNIIKMVLGTEARQLEGRGYLEEAIKVYEILSTFIAEEDKENPLETLKNIQRLTLRNFSRMGNTKVKINNCGDGACQGCKQLNGKIIDISEALKEMPLPNSSCSFDLYRNGHSFCRCSYEIVSDSLNIRSKKMRKEYGKYKIILLPAVIVMIIILLYLYYINLYSY